MKKLKSFLLGVVSVFAFSSFAATYYVSKENARDTNDGSEASPFASVYHAVSVAKDGDEIIVEDGTYKNPAAATAGIYVDKAITLRSRNGRSKTVLQGQGINGSRVLFLNNTGARVEGFKITGGGQNSATIDNVSKDHGGGAVILAGTLADCNIVDNVVFGYGAGIYMKDGLVSRCIISGNKNNNGWGYGGGIYASGNSIIEHSLIFSNTISYGKQSRGGGIYATGNTVIRNCTVTKNTSVTCGLDLGGTCVLLDTVSFGNTARDYTDAPDLNSAIPEAAVTNFSSSAKYGTVMDGDQPASDSTKLVITDPAKVFADYDGGDYSLVVGSPCIDAAFGAATVDKDVAGSNRVQGARMDIGAYEFTPPPGDKVTIEYDNAAIASAVVSPAYGTHDVVSGENAFTAPDGYFTLDDNSYYRITGWECIVSSGAGVEIGRLSGEGCEASITHDAGNILRFIWKTGGNVYYKISVLSSHPDLGTAALEGISSGEGYFEDGVTVSVAATANGGDFKKWVSSESGILTDESALQKAVSFTATKSAVLTAIYPMLLEVSESGTYKTVSAALEAADHYDEIVVPPGTYTGGITLSKAITLRSLSGPAQTTLKGPSDVRVVSIKHAGARVEGFKITGGAGGVSLSAGVLDKCIVANNSYFGNGGGVYATGGLVTRCIITGNDTKTENYAQGGGVRLVNAVIENSLVYDNLCQKGTQPGCSGGGIWAGGGAVIRNCTVTRNTGYYAGIRLGSTDVTVLDTISYGNITNNVKGTADFFGSSTKITNVCSSVQIGTVMKGKSLVIGEGDTLFKDAENDDFRLERGSCCINAAYGAATVTTDLAGNPRVRGGRMDIGCYESPYVPGFSLLVR